MAQEGNKGMMKPDLLTVDEVAARLQLSSWTVRQMIKRGDIPKFPLRSNVVRVSRAALTRWIAEQDGTALESPSNVTRLETWYGTKP